MFVVTSAYFNCTLNAMRAKAVSKAMVQKDPVSPLVQAWLTTIHLHKISVIHIHLNIHQLLLSVMANKKNHQLSP